MKTGTKVLLASAGIAALIFGAAVALNQTGKKNVIVKMNFWRRTSAGEEPIANVNWEIFQIGGRDPLASGNSGSDSSDTATIGISEEALNGEIQASHDGWYGEATFTVMAEKEVTVDVWLER